MEEKWEYNETVHQLFVEFGVSMKLVRLVKMCLIETCSKVHIGKHLSDSFPIQCGLKRRSTLSSPLFDFALEYAIRSRKTKCD
jgi:hypothetical protein